MQTVYEDREGEMKTLVLSAVASRDYPTKKSVQP